jgi:hypothetical protein
MINYASAVNALGEAGYKITNKCHFDGETFHDFNSRKKDECFSLVIDESTGAVSRIEVSTRKWDSGRYIPVKETITGLQQLKDKLAPRTAISF